MHRLWLAMVLVASAFGCGGKAAITSAEGGDASTGADGSTDRDASTGGDGGGSAACTPTFVDAGTGWAGDAEVPVYHRAAPACCTSQRGPGPGGQPYSSQESRGCSSDSQCDGGANGRCLPFGGLVGPGGCSYDECFTDSDCPAGTPCVCRGSASDGTPNVCATGGNCVVDSDCGPGGYCSPSQGCWGVTAYEPSSAPYFCHTAKDTCINDFDCAVVDAGAACETIARCAYSAQAQHWACTQLVCCPP